MTEKSWAPGLNHSINMSNIHYQLIIHKHKMLEWLMVSFMSLVMSGITASITWMLKKIFFWPSRYFCFFFYRIAYLKVLHECSRLISKWRERKIIFKNLRFLPQSANVILGCSFDRNGIPFIFLKSFDFSLSSTS